MFVNSPIVSTILKRSFASVRSISTVRTTISGHHHHHGYFKFNRLFSTIGKIPKPTTYSYSSYSSYRSSSSTMKLLFASTGASFLIISAFTKQLIHNDSALLNTSQSSLDKNISAVKSEIEEPFKKSRFNNYLNYEELTIGSVVGLFLGIIIGKLSQVIVLISLLSYFLVEFLENKNIIHIPWNYFITIGKERINLKELVFEKPSFKISFVLAFIIAAYNV